MASKKPGVYKIQIHSDAIAKLLKSREVQEFVEERTNAIHQAAGGDEAGFEAEVIIAGGGPKRNRVMGFVRTATPAAKRAEAEDRTLTRAVNAGRG